MAPSFPDKSVQGIINVINSELPCIGSVSDKSVQGIITKASAAGANITNKSVQGCIDVLSGFSCAPPPPTLPPLDPTMAFKWDLSSSLLVARSDASTLTILSSQGIHGHIAGTITVAPSNSASVAILLISIKLSVGGNVIHTINSTIDGNLGISVPRSYDDAWHKHPTANIWCYDSSSQGLLSSVDAYWNVYYTMPGMFRGDYVGGQMTLLGYLLSGTLIQHPIEGEIPGGVSVGNICTVSVACGAVSLSSGAAINPSLYTNRDLWAEHAAGATGITTYSFNTTVLGSAFTGGGYDYNYAHNQSSAGWTMASAPVF